MRSFNTSAYGALALGSEAQDEAPENVLSRRFVELFNQLGKAF